MRGGQSHTAGATQKKADASGHQRMNFSRLITVPAFGRFSIAPAVHRGNGEAAQTLRVALASLRSFDYPLSDYLADKL